MTMPAPPTAPPGAPTTAPSTAPPGALRPPPLTIEAMAQRFAAMERDEAELAIDTQVATAIREWRISDATFWQRIKFRSRMIRTATAHRAASPMSDVSGKV